MTTNKAPTVYMADGTPVKVRIVGGECEGDVSGEGHFAYRPRTEEAEYPTVYFEEVTDQ